MSCAPQFRFVVLYISCLIVLHKLFLCFLFLFGFCRLNGKVFKAEFLLYPVWPVMSKSMLVRQRLSRRRAKDVYYDSVSRDVKVFVEVRKQGARINSVPIKQFLKLQRIFRYCTCVLRSDGWLVFHFRSVKMQYRKYDDCEVAVDGKST